MLIYKLSHPLLFFYTKGIDCLYYVLYSIVHKEVLILDIQLKKGLLEICVLSVLKQADSYGYQINKDVSKCISISESTLYPILRRLESNQHLTTYSIEHNGRLRKYYKITSNGQLRIQEFLDEWDDMMHIYTFIKGEQEHE